MCARIGRKVSCQFLKVPRLSGGCHRCSALGMRSIMFWLAPPLPCIRQTRKEDLRVIFPLDSYSSSPAVPLDHRRPANSRRLVAWPGLEPGSPGYEPGELAAFDPAISTIAQFFCKVKAGLRYHTGMDFHNLLGGVSPWMLLVGGAALGWLKNFWSFFYNHTLGYVLRKLHVSVTVEEHETEEVYMWLALWAEKRIREKRITDLLIRRKRTLEGDAYQAIPHYGTYYLRYQGRYLLVFGSDKGDQAGTPGSSEGAMSFLRPRRTIYIAIWGTLNREVITSLIEEARHEFYAQLEKKLFIYNNENSWWETRELSPRSLDTIYLPEGVIDAIVSDVNQFLEIKDKYRLLGIPWRRGFLLHGPPGTGKSSLVQALATHLELPLYYLNLAGVDRSEDLQRLVNNVSTRSILLIEDVDCVPAARERVTDKEGHETTKGIIASDLLNVIDGVVATEGRLLVLTTNHPERLDPALVRKGRIDREFHLSWAEEPELEKFHARAKGVFEIPDYDQFRAMLPASATIADAQALLFGKEKFLEIEVAPRLHAATMPTVGSRPVDQVALPPQHQMPASGTGPLVF